MVDYGAKKPVRGKSIPRASLHTVEADGVRVFYREAGPADAPVLRLLHGYPASSHMFRELIPRMATSYRVIAPDLPGFGFTTVPAAQLQIFVRRARAHRGSVRGDAGIEEVRAVHFRLRGAGGIAACGSASRTSDGDRVAEWQRL